MITYRLGEKPARACIAALLETAPWHMKAHLNKLLETIDFRGIELRVQRARRKRTDAQNAYYWLCIGIFAKAVGMTPDETHEAVLCEYHGSTEVRIGTRVHHVPKGRSHNLPVEAMNELIETAHRVAAFCNVTLPDAEAVA